MSSRVVSWPRPAAKSFFVLLPFYRLKLVLELRLIEPGLSPE